MHYPLQTLAPNPPHLKVPSVCVVQNVKVFIAVLDETLDPARRRAFGNLDQSFTHPVFQHKCLVNQLKAWAVYPVKSRLSLRRWTIPQCSSQVEWANKDKEQITRDALLINA